MMVSLDIESLWLSTASCESFNIHTKERDTLDAKQTVPRPPPPLPCKTCRWPKQTVEFDLVAKETKEARHRWDRLFKEGFDADVYVVTEDNSCIPAHSSVLRAASAALGSLLCQARIKNNVKCLKILGVPSGALYTFLRFLYSSCYEEEEMKKFALHLLVLSHCFSIMSLKRLCEKVLEQGLLMKENVVDMLQLARKCDAPRLSLICTRMIIRDFKSISSTEGWKIMQRTDNFLEQELIESVIEAETQRQDRQRKTEEKKVYLQLYEAMEALLHICKDGCRTIGPRNKALKESKTACHFSACKGLENLVRHFYDCKARVPGGCVHCKRMWQLLELHSRMCDDPDSCKVPLCRHFKEKILQQSKKDEAKWTQLVTKVMVAKIALRPFSARHFALS